MASKQNVKSSTRSKCRQPIRDPKTGLEIGKCDMPIMNDSCINRKNHVHKYRTGFCIDGHCEGTNFEYRPGKYYKTCTFWLTCPCECHTKISEIYAMTKRERLTVEDKYAPEHSGFVLPERSEMLAELLDRKASTAPVIVVKSDSPVIPDKVKKEYGKQIGGRSHRGQLEQFVQDACDQWIRDGKKVKCTTSFISDWIFETQDVAAPPSRGAIDAVFKRWTDIGFAFIAPNPTRFAGYMPDGIKYGLEGLKKKRKEEHANKFKR